MRWNDIGEQPCSIARALSVIGDRWTMLVLREAFVRTRRFEDFHRNTGMSRAILAERLRELVDEGVLERRPYGNHPDRFEYRLTEKGLDLYPVLVSLLAWGDRWMGDTGGPPVIVKHKACGHEGTPELACPGCGEWVGARDMAALSS